LRSKAAKLLTLRRIPVALSLLIALCAPRPGAQMGGPRAGMLFAHLPMPLLLDPTGSPVRATLTCTCGRAGSAAASRLFKRTAVAEWQANLDAYERALEAVGAHRKKLKELVKWNEHLASVLPRKFQEGGHLTLEDMETVMHWKITKHTFRPLMGQLKSNAPALVEKATAVAFKACAESSPSENAAKASLAALCQLRGIGPATASAVLAHVNGAYPFMADEALEGCGLDRKYDVQTYLLLMKRLQAKACELGGTWTAELVGRAMWTAAMAHVHALKITPSSAASSSPPQVREQIREGASAQDSEDPTPVKSSARGAKRKVAAPEDGGRGGGTMKTKARKTAVRS
jgi:endonuclease III